MSPERIAPGEFGFKNSRPTIASDCYALGMVIYEIISGNVPFHKDTDLSVSMKVVAKGERPPRGAKFTKRLWEMLELCWAPKPNHRPGVEDVLWCLEVVSNSSEPPSPVAEEGTDEEGDDWDSEPGSSSDDTFDFFATDDTPGGPVKGVEENLHESDADRGPNPTGARSFKPFSPDVRPTVPSRLLYQ